MTILDKIGEPAMLEQLAEEAAELSQAALKLARIKRGENPTPVTEAEAIENLIEEIADVKVCLNQIKAGGVLGEGVNWLIKKHVIYKTKRWCKRLLTVE